MDRTDVEVWVGRYEVAWRTNDPEDVRVLFTAEARYFTAPFREPWSGIERIVSEWIDRADEPGSWGFRSEVLAVADGLGFVRGWTTYDDGPDYANLWVVRLEPDGRASEFVEWWMAVEE